MNNTSITLLAVVTMTYSLSAMEIKKLPSSPNSIVAVAYPDDTKAMGLNTCVLTVWNPESGKSIDTIKIDEKYLLFLAGAIKPDGTEFEITKDNQIVMFDINTHAEKATITEPSVNFFQAAAYHPHDDQLALLCDDQKVRIYDTRSKNMMLCTRWLNRNIFYNNTGELVFINNTEAAAFSKSDMGADICAVGTNDGFVFFYNDSFKNAEWKVFSYSLRGIAYNQANPQKLIAGSYGGEVALLHKK